MGTTDSPHTLQEKQFVGLRILKSSVIRAIYLNNVTLIQLLQQWIGEVCNVGHNIQLSSQATQLNYVFQLQTLPILFHSFSFPKMVHESCQTHCLTVCIFLVSLPCTVLLRQDGRSPVIGLSSIFFRKVSEKGQ